MLKKILIFLISLLFITIPIINSNLGELFWIKLWLNVNWNYEFSKIIFFNIISSIIIFLFFIYSILNKKSIKIPKLIFIIILFFSISTFFSISPYISFFWNNKKGHWLLMFINLISLFIIFLNLSKKEKKKFLKYSLIGLLLSSLIAIWQLYFPTFNYGNLSNRALWTFWHPNYLALYLLLYLLILIHNKLQLKNNLNLILLILLITALILTKSFIWIFIWLSYLWVIYYKNLNWKNKKLFLILLLIGVFFISFIILHNFWYTKIHSFISRFFIWETTLRTIIESPKTFLIWNWFETLNLVFEKNKSPFLYIFENFGYTADRPHNILLLFFYSTGIFGFFLITTIYYIILKFKTSVYKESLLLAFIFLLFNFASITSYLLIILFLSFLIKTKNKNNFNYLFFFILTIISLYWAYNSYLYYKAENYIKHWKIINITNIFKYNPNYYFKNWEPEKWLKYINQKTELYYKSKIYFKNDLKNWCLNLTQNYPSVENYFFCGDIYWNIDKNIAKKYYLKWLKKLPNLWNKNSKYYNYIIIKDTINWNRFFSSKYSNIKIILKRMLIKLEK